MNYFSLDYLIVYAFLIITLIIGFKAGSNVKKIREYAIGTGDYGTAMLVFTFLATTIGGGSTIDAASNIFSEGIIVVVASLGVIVQVLLFIVLVVPHMKYFKAYFTMGEVMGSLYGRTSQILTGVMGSLHSFCMVGMQLHVLGIVADSLLGVPASLGIVLGGLFVVLYSAHGGIKAITATDVFQFLILFIFIPIIASIVLHQAGGIVELFRQVPVEKFQVLKHESFSFYLMLFLIWSFLPLGLVSPPIFQRLLMAKRTEDLRNQYLILVGLVPLFRITIMLIGLGGLVLYPHVQPAGILPHIIQVLLPVGMKGLAMAGMLTVVMSTADSYLHTAGLSLAHDVIQPFLKSNKTKGHELTIARWSTVLIGLISIAVALKTTSALQLSFAAMRMSGPLLLFPLLAGIMGLKPDKKAFYGAGGITIIAFTLLSIALPTKHTHLAMLISIIINATSFIIIHLLQNKGLALEQRLQPSMTVDTFWQPHTKTMLKGLSQLLPKPIGILNYSRKKVEQYGAPYVLFGVFVGVNLIYPYFFMSSNITPYYSLAMILRLVGAVLCGLLIAHEQLPASWQPYIPTLWHLSVLYCLPFINTVLLLLPPGDMLWLANMAITTIFMIVLLDWMSFLILSTLGAAVGFLVIRQVTGEMPLHLDFTSQYMLIYQLVFASLIGLVFTRRKPKTVYDTYEPIFYQTFLGKQSEFMTNVTKRLAEHIVTYISNTERAWFSPRDMQDGFYTMYVVNMDTIEDPDLYKLLVEISPSIKAMREEALTAVRDLKTKVRFTTIAANMHLQAMKVCIINGVIELNIDYPTYSYTIYQLVDADTTYPSLRIVTITPTQEHLQIRDYSQALSPEETLPFLHALFTSPRNEHSMAHREPYLKILRQSISVMQKGYKSYMLGFPNMEISV